MNQTIGQPRTQSHASRPQPSWGRLRALIGVVALTCSLYSVCGAQQSAPSITASQQLAQAIVNADSVDAERQAAALMQLEVKNALHCDANPATSNSGYQCVTGLIDPRDSARVATILFLISDANFDFEQASAVFQRKYIQRSVPDPQGGPKKIISLPGHCYQVQGDHNGPAACAYLAEPRVLVVAIITPHSANMAVGDTTPTDMTEAKNLALTGITMLRVAR
jgi:hypothetical protein